MAGNNSKLYITISDDRGNGSQSTPTKQSSGGTGGNNSGKQIAEEDNAVFRYAEHEMFHMAKNLATQSVNFSMNNIGNFTGDYIAQRRVNEMRQAASGIVSIGMTTLAGAKYGLTGAVVGFLVGTYSMLTGSVFEVIVNQSQNAKANYNISQLRQRVGLNSIYDGSRGTEN